MPKNLEIEKKFIIRYPDTEYLKSLPDCEYSHIEQIYLLSEGGRSERIRKRSADGSIKYYHTMKYHITDMTRVEEERLISKEEYECLKHKADPDLNIICKTRYCLPYEGHTLEIDVFPFWDRQAYLEIELQSEDEKYLIPDFINVLCDVTTERKYTNRALAKSIPEQN
ncbi:MAG: hypothetical protein J6D26_03010 [Clostridia bacterium]|nr:hypothetical protein [Clostridia bacterium]